MTSRPILRRKPTAHLLSMSTISALSTILALSTIVVSLAGCGSDRPPVFPTQGKVVFSDGQPVKLGTVEFFSDEHQLSATGTIRNNGTFQVGTFTSDDGAVAGRHRVIVTQLIINDAMTKHVMDHGSPVDPIFGSFNSSPLEVVIQDSGPNEITLTVEKAPRRK